jgi:xylose dehydrogenase (NAD/NADP)
MPCMGDSILRTMPRLRMGVLGAGGIAGHFCAASPQFDSVDVVAIGSRDKAKGDAFAAKYGLQRAYGSYQEIVDDKDLDAVYIALPNGLHKEWAIACARAGKHILCEKPMALTRADGEEMFAEADKHRLVLIEGFPFRFQSQMIEVLKRVRSGELGEILTVTGCFGFQMRDPNNVRLDPTQGAGATWDVGVYPINLVRAVMGKAPKSVLASSRFNENGVDLTTTAILTYDDGRQTSIWSSFESITFRRANIVGTEGAIDFSHNNHPLTPEAASFLLQRGQGKDILEERIQTEPGNGFVFEANAFAELVAGGSEFHGTTREESLDNIATVQAILRIAKSGRVEAVTS